MKARSKPKSSKKPLWILQRKKPIPFSEWLKLPKARPIVREQKPDSKVWKRSGKGISNWSISSFPNNPSLSPRKLLEKIPTWPNLHQTSESLMTETLARVYATEELQKAIQAYKFLILKILKKVVSLQTKFRPYKNVKRRIRVRFRFLVLIIFAAFYWWL